MIKPRTIIAAVLALAATGLLSPSHALEEGELLIWIGGDKGYRGLAKLGERFTEELGIEVRVEYPEDATGKFQQAAAAAKGPDVFIWAHDRVGEWQQAGLLSPVEPGREAKASVGDIGWEAFTLNGQIWGYPIAYEAVALIYNRSLVDEPPASFEEVVALDERLSGDGKKAILWDYTNTYFTWPLMAADGGYVFARDDAGNYDVSDVGVNNAGAVAGAEMLVSLVDRGIMPKGAQYKDMEAGVNQGSIAMMINGPWSWGNLRQSGIDFGVSTIPTVNGKPGRPFVGVLGAMINQASPNKDLAVEFCEGYLMSVEGLKTIDADVPLGVPANKTLFAELAAKDERIAASMDNVNLGEPMPAAPEMGAFWSAMASALENMTQGRQSPREALNAAASRITN